MRSGLQRLGGVPGKGTSEDEEVGLCLSFPKTPGHGLHLTSEASLGFSRSLSHLSPPPLCLFTPFQVCL